MTENLPKLVIATDNFIPRRDGITRFLTTVLPHLQKHFQITIICPDFENNNIDLEGITFVRIPLRNYYVGDFKPAKLCWKTVKKAVSKADIVFSQTIGWIGAAAVYSAYRQKKQVVAYIHSIEWLLVAQAFQNWILKKLAKPVAKIVSKFLYRRCNDLIVPSERIADMLSWEKINTPKQVINLGVDTKQFISKEMNDKRNFIRETYGIDSTDVVIGYHGRISPEKDLLTLIRAFIILRKKYSNVKLMIVGSGIPSLEKVFEKQPGVIHIPVVETVEHFISAMDIYCLPSLTETTSLSTLEAMSCSLPIITTGAGFIKDYVQSGKNGYFFPKKDSFSLAKKLEKLYKNPELRKSFGKVSREIAVTDFKWSTTEKKLVSFLRSMVKE